MARELPSGTVTFLFTDVEGSTRLLHELGAEDYAEALAEHRRVIREACAAEGGVEVDTQGDAFFFAFPSAPGALVAAAALTEALRQTEISVRVGIHSGEPLLAGEGYVGSDVHLAARIASSAHGGQVVLSAATRELLEVSGSEPQALPAVSLGSHRLKDVSEPVSLLQLGEDSFPPLKTIANTNLPTPASSFLGREGELYEADLLLQGTRLLTVSGAGGAGKTRFALELARRAREERFADYGDGVFACFLASLRDPALVLPTLCQTLSVAEQPGVNALEALTAQLQGKRLLLLLDNLEHLLEAAPELSHLLERCPGLSLVVTSRELLRVQGEAEFELPPLVEAEAVALFCERARVEPSETISALCRRLDGLPLALELAAARVRVLTPAQLLERLSSRLDLLKGGRDTDPRQQTLRATIEWSYELLTAEEQRLFRALAVFHGGSSLEAAEDVAGADLDTLQSLVEKSLLRVSDGRFWMLETIHEYAGESLARSGEASDLRQRQADWMLTFAETVEPALEGSDAARWLAVLDGELDNVRATLLFLQEAQDVGAQLVLVGRLWNFWYTRAHWSEARRWVAPALEASRGERTRRRAHALHADAVYALNLGQLDDARVRSSEALQTFRELGDAKGIAWLLAMLAMLAADADDLDEAERLYEDAISYARGVDPRTVAYQKGNLADIAMRRRDYRRALALTDEAIALFRDLGLEQGVYQMLGNRGLCMFSIGRVKSAAAIAERALLAARRHGDVYTSVAALALVSSCAARSGRAVEGATLAGAVAIALEEVGLRLTGPEGELYLGTVEELRRILGDAGFAAACEHGRLMTIDDAVDYTLGPLRSSDPGSADAAESGK